MRAALSMPSKQLHVSTQVDSCQMDCIIMPEGHPAGYWLTRPPPTTTHTSACCTGSSLLHPALPVSSAVLGPTTGEGREDSRHPGKPPAWSRVGRQVVVMSWDAGWARGGGADIHLGAGMPVPHA
jgi:hypothetical protein